MRPLITGLDQLLDTQSMPWIATGPGKAFRPLRFTADGWSELMRLDPGSMVALHRHTGEVHAFNLSGTREIFGTGERVGPGNYGAWRGPGRAAPRLRRETIPEH